MGRSRLKGEGMGNLFDLVEIQGPAGGQEKRLRVGIRVTIGDQENLCALTPPVDSVGKLTREITFLKQELDDLLERAELFFGEASRGTAAGLRPDMSAAEIWTLLSEMRDEETFVARFNDLKEEKRREVADYVFTTCNVFAGRASLFSARYNEESARME